jgi:hypothetical protein
MKKLSRTFQICYSPEIRKTLDPGFEIIGDESNPRPDWFEYWHIRSFLKTKSLEDDVFYGFFSPKFRQKTSLKAYDVYNFIEKNKESDVILFSPYYDQISLFLNIVEQGCFAHPELRDTFESVSNRYFNNLDVDIFATTSRNTVFCNFFVAKRPFWERWFEICEDIYDISEKKKNTLGVALTGTTHYRKQQVPLKTFLIERIPTLLLYSDPRWSIANYSPYNCEIGKMCPASAKPNFLDLDSLKISFIETSKYEFLARYFDLRLSLMRAITPVNLLSDSRTTYARISQSTSKVVNKVQSHSSCFHNQINTFYCPSSE